jgi:ATP phosphoribosyltransferase regulatory subunit
VSRALGARSAPSEASAASDASDPAPAPPRGFRDILPTEARELRAIERSLMDAFATYGYMPLEPPMVERSAGESGIAGERVMRFLDRDGSLAALRPDMTTAVARLVAQRYPDAAGTLRLSYFGPVFREEPAMLGVEREFAQAGIELVGAPGPLADAEALALLAHSLAAVGLKDATIEVGHVGVVRELFAELAVDVRDAVMRELRDGDHVGAFRRARDAGMSEVGLARAREVIGTRGALSDLDLAGVARLREVLELARETFAPTASCAVPNLSLVPALPYYTGIVFEVVHPRVGFPIAAGGRYDLLLGGYGAPRPAIGFAINVPRLHLALFAGGWRPHAERALVVLAPGDPLVTARLAAGLRAAGVAVAIGPVAETAGLRAIHARTVDERHAVLADGQTLDIEALRDEAATTAR